MFLDCEKKDEVLTEEASAIVAAEKDFFVDWAPTMSSISSMSSMRESAPLVLMEYFG